MSEGTGPGAITAYDRQLLLFGSKQEAVLDLAEIHRFGVDSYGDADHVSLYGMRPSEWYDCGVRVLGRTAVECTYDSLAERLAEDVAAVAGSVPSTASAASAASALVIDPFAGSGNTLHWIVRGLSGAAGLGFELDPVVWQLTSRNLAVVESRLQVLNVDYLVGLDEVSVSRDRLVVVFVAPPWGAALDPVSGLDLRRSSPPVGEVVDAVVQRFPGNPLLLAVQIFEKLEPDSRAELEGRFDWSAVHVYDFNPPGLNPGVLVGTRNWAPPDFSVARDWGKR